MNFSHFEQVLADLNNQTAVQDALLCTKEQQLDAVHQYFCETYPIPFWSRNTLKIEIDANHLKVTDSELADEWILYWAARYFPIACFDRSHRADLTQIQWPIVGTNISVLKKDIWAYIASFLHVKDRLSMRRVNRDIRSYFKESCMWNVEKIFMRVPTLKELQIDDVGLLLLQISFYSNNGRDICENEALSLALLEFTKSLHPTKRLHVFTKKHIDSFANALDKRPTKRAKSGQKIVVNNYLFPRSKHVKAHWAIGEAPLDNGVIPAYIYVTAMGKFRVVTEGREDNNAYSIEHFIRSYRNWLFIQ